MRCITPREGVNLGIFFKEVLVMVDHWRVSGRPVAEGGDPADRGPRGSGVEGRNRRVEGAQCWPAMLARCGAGACRQGRASPSSRSGAEGRVAAVVCIRAVLAGVNTRLACIAASGQSPRLSNPVAPQSAAVFERECTGSDAFLTWQGDVPSPITHQQFNNLCYNWQKASGRGGGGAGRGAAPVRPGHAAGRGAWCLSWGGRC